MTSRGAGWALTGAVALCACAGHWTAPGDPDPRSAPRYTLTRDVYPVLERACSGCHTRGGSASSLPLDEGPENTYGALLGRPGLVDLVVPERSALLTRPLAGNPPDHPTEEWADVDHPDYVMILTWIRQSAPL